MWLFVLPFCVDLLEGVPARPYISGGTGVAKMASHAIFQYNVLVIDMDNTTLGLI